MENEMRIDKAPWDEDDLGIEVTVHHKDGGSINGRLAYIYGLETWNTGGGCMVDVIRLQDGRFLGLSDELVVLYNTEDEFYGVDKDGEAIDYAFTSHRPLIDLIKENFQIVETETILHGRAYKVKAFQCVSYVSRARITQNLKRVSKDKQVRVSDFLIEEGKKQSPKWIRETYPYLNTHYDYDHDAELWTVETLWEHQPLEDIAPIKVKIDQEVVSFRALDPELGDEVLLDSDSLTHLLTIMKARELNIQEVMDRALSAYYFQVLSEAQEKVNVRAFYETRKDAQAQANKIIYG